MKKVKPTSTNRRAVVESVQAYLLAWVNGYKSETSFSDEVNESAFVHVVDMYMNDYGKGKKLRCQIVEYSMGSAETLCRGSNAGCVVL